MFSPVSACQIIIMRSVLPVAILEPSGLNATALPSLKANLVAAVSPLLHRSAVYGGVRSAGDPGPGV